MLRPLAHTLTLLLCLLAARLPAQQAAAPAAAPAVDVAALLGRVPELAGHAWTADTRLLPIVPVVAQGGDPTRGLAQRCGAWAHALLRMFTRDYATPAGRAPAADWTLLVVVLRDPELFAKVREGQGVLDARDSRAFLLPTVPAVVVLDDDGRDDEVADSLRALLHSTTHALLTAHAAPGAATPLWLAEGLAERLSSNTGFEPPTTAALRAPDDAAIHAIARDFRDPARRAACVRPLRELCTLATPADLDARVGRMAIQPREALAGMAREGGLLLGWLEDGEKGKRRAEVPAMVTAALTGAPVALADVDATEAAFGAWLSDAVRERAPEAGVSDFTLGGAAAGTGEIRAGIVAQPSDLKTPKDDPDLEIARVLREAALGDLPAAQARLDALIAWPKLSPEQTREFASDKRALASLAGLRARWLADRVGKELDLVSGGKVEHVQVLEVRADGLTVKDTRGTERKEPLTAVTPGVLAEALQGTGLMNDANEDEARALAFVLAADTRWKDKVEALVRTETGPAGLPRLDARAALETSARTGRAAFGLEDLATRALPAADATDKDRDAWLARVRDVLADADLPLVAQRATALRALAGQVLGARFDAAPLKTLALKGKIDELPGGRVRASWDFSAPATWSDWKSVPPDVPFAVRPANERANVQDGGAVEDHWLVLRGDGQWRCPLGFQPPLSAEWDLVFKLSPDEAESTSHGVAPPKQKVADHVELRLLADGRGNSLAVRDFGALQRHDRTAGVVVAADSKMITMTLEKTYHFRVEYDGTSAKVLSNSMQMAALDTTNPGGAYLDFWHDTGRPIAIRRLVVEGKLDQAALKASRDAWVAARVEELSAKP